jgi:pSer/pThr/pTyr-binding forkhead associated (FHA) protein
MILRLLPEREGQAGDPVEVPYDQPATFGRISRADHAYLDDDFMSGLHFEVRFADTQWMVKDLGSSNGLLVNGAKVTESPVANGDEIFAGSTTFRAEVVISQDQPPPVKVVEAIRDHPDAAYAIIDAARAPNLLALIEQNAECAVSLFDGTPLEDHREQAPYLVNFGEDETLLLTFVYGGWDGSAGIYLASAAEFGALTGHMRRLLFAQTEDGRRLLFRYYDPRVLRSYLPTCAAGETAEFFGPVSAVFAEEDAERWRKYANGPAGLQDNLLDFSAHGQ